jgi:hypothetical protein
MYLRVCRLELLCAVSLLVLGLFFWARPVADEGISMHGRRGGHRPALEQ